MKIVSQKIQSLIRSILGVPKAPDEISDRMSLVANVIPTLVFNTIQKRFETVFGWNGALLINQTQLTARITTATTTTLGRGVSAVIAGVIVSSAGTAGQTATFRDAGGTTIFSMKIDAVGIFNIPFPQGIVDVVSSAAASPADFTVCFQDLGEFATENTLLTGA